MKIEVCVLGMVHSESLREHVRRRIHFQLSRVGSELSAAIVRIADVNGPKGGVDKCCRVTMRGPRLSPLVVEERSSDAYAAVDGALQRAAQTAGRRLERARTPAGAAERDTW